MGESEIEDALLDKLQEFLLELGYGFCFEARQKRILIGSKQCFVDMNHGHGHVLTGVTMPAIASLEDLKVAQRRVRSMFLAASPNDLRLTIYGKKGEGGRDF